jgi:VanZ family protein
MTHQTGDTIALPLGNTTGGWSRVLRSWLPALCWMALIFFLSSLRGSSLSNFGPLDLFVKKGAHITEYALLYFFLFRAIHTVVVTRKAFVISAIIAVLYAISDEYHQTFVLLREGTVRDVFIDCIGIFLMYLFLRRRHSRSAKPLS